MDRITIEVIDEDVTTEIEDRLKWLKSLDQGKLNGDRFRHLRKEELSAHLSTFLFDAEPAE